MRSFEICDDIDKCLLRLKFADDLAVATSRLHVKTLSFQQNIFCFEPPETISTYLTTFMVHSDFIFNSQVNSIFSAIIQSGLIAKWKTDLKLEHKTLNYDEEVRKISMADLHFLLIIFTTCMLFSSVVLLYEILINHKVKSNKSARVWKILEKSVCGRRYYFLLQPSNDDVIIPFTQ